MLREFVHVKQEIIGRRRWFQDDDLELIVWYDPGGAVVGFQICYGADDNEERALTWRNGLGFAHDRIDSGGTNPAKNLTPILVPDGAVLWEFVINLLRVRGQSLDSDLRDLVLERLAARR